MNTQSTTRVIRPVNGIGPGIGRGARYEAEKRSRAIASQRQRELERAKLAAASHGIFEGRRLEAIAQTQTAHNGIGRLIADASVPAWLRS